MLRKQRYEVWEIFDMGVCIIHALPYSFGLQIIHDARSPVWCRFPASGLEHVEDDDGPLQIQRQSF